MTSISERLGNWFPVVLAFGLPLFFLPSLVDAFILPRASFVVGGACVGAGLALLVARPTALGELRWPLIAAAGAALVAFAFSTSWPLSLIGSYTRYESLPMRLSYLGLLAAPVWLLRGELARSVAAAAFVLAVMISSAEALIQWNLALPFRPDGNLGNANLLGALIAMALPFALREMLRPGWLTAGWWAAAMFLIAGLFVSNSRSGFLGALAGALVLGVFALRGRWALVAGTGASLLVAAAFVAILVFPPLRDLNGDPGPTRQHLYHDAIAMITSRPLSGWGEDSTGLVFGRFLTGDWSPGVTFDRVHSGVLDVAVTQGVLGVAALGWVLAVLFVGLWKARSLPPTSRPPVVGSVSIGSVAAACAAYTVWVMFNFDWAPATAVFWLLAGVGWSAVQSRRATAPAVAPGPPRRVVLRLAGALALVAVAFVFAALPLVAEAWYANGRPDLAVRADPLQSEYHRALGEALIDQGKLDEGRAELRLATNLGATDPAVYVELGDADLRAGDVAQARADYEMALTIDPFWTPARQRLTGGGLGTA